MPGVPSCQDLSTSASVARAMLHVLCASHGIVCPQFKLDGCENCPHLNVADDVNMWTSPHFAGFVTIPARGGD